MITLSNEQIEIAIKAKGAELTNIAHKQFNIDYLWNADPEYWGKHAPVLFPIVGTLKDNTYSYDGKDYNLSRHGFAREQDFDLIFHDESSASFELRSNEATLLNYPFTFIFRIHYSLEGNKLINKYEVINDGENNMLFSVGGHPAFNVPLHKGLNYDDYYLEFDQPETAPRWTLQDNLINTHPKLFLENQNILHLNHELFASDAIVLKELRSKNISLKSKASKHGLTMRIEEFPYLGIWAAPEAPFVCIEPWQGIADSLYHNQQLEQKEGMVTLAPKQAWHKTWDILFW